MLADDIGFTTDDQIIADRARETPSKVERLLSTSLSLPGEINALLSAEFALGTPSERHLPNNDVDAARALGFEPICFVHWGHWPLPLMRTPNWIGPEGFVKLDVYGRFDVYRRGLRRYLTTYFDDGTALSSKPADSEGGNLRTTYLDAVGDFHYDYKNHLETAKEYCEKTGARPLYRPTTDLVIQCWKIYSHLHVGPGQGLALMAMTWSIPLTLIYALFFA